MEKNSAYLDLETYRKGRAEMSDRVLATDLVVDIGGKGRTGDTIYRALTMLRKLFPHTDEPHKQWTERRLKAWWNRESENVMHWQMVELYHAAAKAKNEREMIAAARREHAEFIRKTASIAALLEHQDEAFNGPQIAALREQFGRMDRTGNPDD